MTSNVTAVSYGLNMTSAGLEQLRSVLASEGAQVLAETAAGDDRYQVRVLELALPDATAAGLAALRRAVAEAAMDGFDTAIVPAALRTAARKLLIMDVDSTLIQQEVIELLADLMHRRSADASVVVVHAPNQPFGCSSPGGGGA